MNSYRIYKHKTKENIAIKIGFAWLAIPFNLGWFISRKLWKVFFSYVLLILFFAGIDYEIYGEVGFLDFSTASDLHWLFLLIEVLVLILPGFKGNEWTVNNIKRGGYEFSYSVQAENKKIAIELTEK
tara:strand:+ start:994 stop:1374 length:381 start_codon:yes stop_codon:yes gene_type:complete